MPGRIPEARQHKWVGGSLYKCLDFALGQTKSGGEVTQPEPGQKRLITITVKRLGTKSAQLSQRLRGFGALCRSRQKFPVGTVEYEHDFPAIVSEAGTNGTSQPEFWGKQRAVGGRSGFVPVVKPAGSLTPNPKHPPVGQSTSFTGHLLQIFWLSFAKGSVLGSELPQEFVAGFQEQKLCG